MRVIERARRSIDVRDVRLSAVRAGDVAEIFESPFELRDPEGALIAVHEVLDGTPDSLALAAAAARVKVPTNYRTEGLPATTKIFGYRPRITIRHDYCGVAALADEQPAEHAVICGRGAPLLAEAYARHNPDQYADHLARARARCPDYTLAGTAFTSGVVNRDNPLKYHLDAGNFRHVWSAMIVFPRAVRGGELVLPEFDLAVRFSPRSIFLFDGAETIHGVAPILKLRPDAYRISLVYYSLRELWNCLPMSEELARIRQKRTERELRRAGRLPDLEGEDDKRELRYGRENAKKRLERVKALRGERRPGH